MIKRKKSQRTRQVPLSLLALLGTTTGFAQAAAPATAANPEAAPVPDDADVVVLSPFEVISTNDKGYYAANTLAGSRMNTNLADLGASISVITLQQMEDTASTDLNDIFRYEVNTEGALTYTPGTQSMRGDGVLDVNAGGTQGNNLSSYTVAGANRVRGLGSPSTATNYYPSIAAVPFDAYNTQSVEISRGPNSMLFGLGSPAGIANQSTASANLSRESGRVAFRFDQYGSFRSSLNFNQPLIKDKLAIYGAALFDDRRFDRKPSYDRTKRLYGAITYQPFKGTTIKANIERYENDNRRPNTLTPRDFVTQWNLAGQPYYDPTTHKITSLATGQALSMVVDNASSPYANDLRNFIATLPGYDASKWNSAKTTYNGVNVFGTNWTAVAPSGVPAYVAGQPFANILYVPGITTSSALAGRNVMQIADGELASWYQPTYAYTYYTGWGTSASPTAYPTKYPSAAAVWANPTWADIYTRTYTQSNGWTGNGNGIKDGAYKYPGVTDKSIYDWTKVNLNSMNFGFQRNTNYNVELDQALPWDLHLNAGWFRQDYFQRTNYTVAQLNVATLYVDTNLTQPDGSPNPYFGKPYVSDDNPDSYITENLDDHYRAMLAWTPDFTRNKGWSKWLGRHQVLGMWSRDETMTTSIRQRLGFVSATSDAAKYRYLNNQNDNADGTPSGWAFVTGNTLRRSYYLASPDDPNGVVTRSAGYWNGDDLTYSGNISTYDYATSSFQPMGVTTSFVDMDANTARNQRIVDSLSGGITSYLWNDRIIATFGVRQDKYKARVTNTGTAAVKDADGNVIAEAITAGDKFVDGYFNRDLLLNRWGPYSELTGTTRTIGGVFRPFKGWTAIESPASRGSTFWQFVRSFGLSYNKSDNFNPPGTALGDFYGKMLPKPTGDGEDYGFQFSLFDEKLFARVTWFKASNLNENVAIPTAAARVRDLVDSTLFRNWARTIARINMGDDPTTQAWNDAIPANSPKELAIQAAAEKIWQLPYDYYTLPYTVGATRNADAKGIEAEINYTPTPAWTMKATFGKQDTKYSNLYPELAPWLEQRMAVWTSAKASDYLLPQYQHFATYNTYAASGDGREVNLTNFWSSYGYDSNVFPEKASANPEAYYNGVVQPLLMLDRDLNGQSAQGQRKYRASFLSTYGFTQGRLKGFSVGGSERWESKAVLGYYGKASGVNLYNGQPVLDMADISRPIYDKEHFYTDMWISYRRPIYKGKVQMKIQLNVNNVFEDGGLRPVAVNYDGTPYSFRIVDPRQYVLTTSFDF